MTFTIAPMAIHPKLLQQAQQSGWTAGLVGAAHGRIIGILLYSEQLYIRTW